ncbi:sigma-54 interaction domain-containing protein [Sporomusa malonica]|uniref:Transcriptional regulator containing PAS, AAA-type ATPase, and DNA-binding Fis domains n=1 Tax=Sporomusa malonica TaxID=112901 RepID=A0A1W1YP72_9FIRM|nr:sigma 54-interacting transcriptional regulator [Sporomusa malonica]SMC37611.1 Transcriptional regulator containing PAS, AAA-type ATPase, and DNA-binding Fis domains [Sporomusa malonica]
MTDTNTSGTSTIQGGIPTINKELLSQERWQAILRYKQEFLQNAAEDPLKHPYMDQEVAASWIRSRNRGVNPYYPATTATKVSLEQLSEILQANHTLIEVTKSLSLSFKEMILACGYIFYLLDNNGVILFHEGSLESFTSLPEYCSRTGIIANEDSEGTTAHELCLRLKRPVQLLGPEHYCVAFQNSIASAAPIKNENDEIKAALVLVSQPLLNTPDEDTLRRMGMYSLGLVTSLATSIETQLALNKTTDTLNEANEKVESFNRQLQITRDKLISVHSTLNATSAFIDEGIVIIDQSGQILHINPAGMHMLKLRPEETNNRNINEFLEGNSCLIGLAKKGENVTIEEWLSVGTDRYSYLVTVRPIINPDTQELDAAVLKISSSEKLTPAQSKKIGSLATYTFEDIISENKEFKKSMALARRFASSPENSLIIGESGTGKELYAQAIHNVYRPQGPFMAVNCAAMPRELIESELFGYEGGSFTGAERSGRPGKIELAHGGTLFLDEIGDMPLELQSVLLRSLEDKQIMRVGGSRYKKVDFRLVAATNKNLYKMVKENLFREDLYFRLSVLTINIPPLRDRGNDIVVLSQYFVESYCRKYGWKTPQISPAAQKKISEYGWPGNVRQLQNAMIYAVNTAQDGLIKPENLPNYIILETCPVKVDKTTTINGNVGEMLCLENLEKAAIETALSHSNNCVPVAAEMLGISRSTLYRKLKDYNIEY